MRPDPVIVLGAAGQVGRGLLACLGGRGVGLTRADLDLNRPDEIESVLDGLSPASVINAAAYTNVDAAERQTALAAAINGEVPGILAAYCARRNIPIVHYSSDYVFSGRGRRPWREDDVPAPINAYGRSKLIGERHIAAAGDRWLIFRTSWVYDSIGRNFLTTMLRLGRRETTIDVVADQFGAPTYASSLARATVDALDGAAGSERFPTGIYHLCAAGSCSWYGFAKAIFRMAARRNLPTVIESVCAVPADNSCRAAARPRNSRLNTDRFRDQFGFEMPHWRADLERCIAILAGSDEDDVKPPV